ncbi:MAG: 50S ribosomal protein L30 [Pseudomonadales bacterium]
MQAQKGPAKKMIRVQLVKSTAGRLKKHRACVVGLGLRRIGHSVEVEDTPSVRGMINRVSYMVKISAHEEAQE